MTRRNSKPVQVPLSSLIDVVFLLIIFFVVTANLEAEIVDEQVRLANSYYIEPQESDLALTINIRAPSETTGVVYSVDGMKLSLDQVIQRARQARQRMGSHLRVILRADARLQYREVDMLTRRLAGVGIYRVQHAAVSRTP